MSIVGLPSSQEKETRLPCPADEHDARVWTEILMNKPRLSTFTGRVLLRGFALKRGPATRDILNWKRHFFVLQFPFLLYFLQNDPTAECVGVAYLRGAMVEHIVHHSSQQNVMRIIPVVRRNLKRTAKDPDEDNFYISFGTERELEKWLGVLNEQLLGKAAGLKEESNFTFSAPSKRKEEERPEEKQAVPERSPPSSPPAATFSTAASSNVTPSNSSNILALNLAPPPAAIPSTKNASQTPASRSPASAGLTAGANRGAVSPSNPSITVTSSTGATITAKEGSTANLGRSAVIRRKSFFTTLDPMATKNTDHIHHTHCSICKVSPVIGYLYTCANCDNVQLCAHCYREVDHDIRHHFYLSPEIASDTLRVSPSLEGGNKTFRTVELVVFEALFRTIGDVLDGAATKPLPKRKLLHFWDSAIAATGGYVDLDVDLATLAAIQPSGRGEGRGTSSSTSTGSGYDSHDSSARDRDGYLYTPPDSTKPIFRIDPITEKSLSWFCRAPGVIAFDEFMNFLRWRIMNGSSQYSAVLVCFSVLTEMIHGVYSEMGYESQPLKARQKRMRRRDGPTAGLDNLEMATLQVYLGTCAVEGKQVRSVDLEAITERLQLLLHYLRRGGTVSAGNLSAVSSSTSGNPDGFDADGSRMIPVEDAMERVILLATSGTHLLCKCPDSVHRVVEVVESAMLYHLGEGFGLYSAQPEAFHACCCDSCGVFPIIGIRYYCSQCCLDDQDFDLCAHCFCFSPPHHQHTQFIKTPGQLPTTLGSSGAGNQSIAAGGSTFSSLAPQSSPTPNKRVQFMVEV